MNEEAREDIEFLISEGVLDEVPDLLGCDMYYYTAGVNMRVYRSDQDIYQKITKALRAEVLEEGELTEEGILLLWMIRESGFIHEVFSAKEQEEISQRMVHMATSCSWKECCGARSFIKPLKVLGQLFCGKRKNFFRIPICRG